MAVNTDEYYLHLMRMNHSYKLHTKSFSDEEYAKLDKSIWDAFLVYHKDLLESLDNEKLYPLEYEMYFIQASERWKVIIERFCDKYEGLNKAFMETHKGKVEQLYLLRFGRHLIESSAAELSKTFRDGPIDMEKRTISEWEEKRVTIKRMIID